MKELSLYIHIPFCVQKCIYCNFKSFPNQINNIEKYFDKLYLEIEKVSQQYKDYIVKTVYIGGGTPSFPDSKYIVKMDNILRHNFKFKKDIEYTIECNPNSLTEQKLIDYKTIGINRFSIGLQACQDDVLKFLNRPHTKRDFENCMYLLRTQNITNFNIDMLIGLPNQTLEMLKETLEYIINFNPTSISAYGLIIENNTQLKRLIQKNKVKPLDDDISVKYYDYVCNVLKKHAYKRYEVSNFAKKNHQSRHNMVYWENGDYLGIGLASHSKVGDTRFCNTENFEKYINEEHKYYKKYHLSTRDKFYERIMLTLRTQKGLNITQLNKEFNINFKDLKSKEIKFLNDNKFIYFKGKYLKITQKGFKVLSSIIDKLT